MTSAAMCATREVWRWPSFYRAEQYDSDLGLYYLRARYYNPLRGRFMSRDPDNPPLRDANGIPIDPKRLHKYLYANGDPVNGLDPRKGGLNRLRLDYGGLAKKSDYSRLEEAGVAGQI